MPDRDREPELGPVQHVCGHNRLQRAPQRVLGGGTGDLGARRQPGGHRENLRVQERHPQLQGVGHRYLVGLDQNVAAQPGEQVDVLHSRHRIPAGRFGVDRRRDICVGPVRPEPGQYFAQLRAGETAGIAVVALFECQRSAVQQTLAAHALRQWLGNFSHRPAQWLGQVVKRPQRQRFSIDCVAAEQFVGAFARQHHFDVLSGLAGDEEQRYQRWVSDRLVEVPDDLGQGGDELVGADHLGDVTGTDGLCRSHRDVDLGEALALETGGEGDQPRIVPDGQRRDGRGVDTPGQKRADGDIGAHMLGHRVLKHCRDLVIAGLVVVVGDRTGRKSRHEITGDHRRELVGTDPGEAA
ncbi:Uncharacterised protein [Mycobacterium tuberculosis]|nr:Uncharacterised protein [Mycobacterium tuberculosis]CFS18776.1 Uncharacterised protein [Mycobacterium tuberculosis]CNW61517.1 Uncharacterised protein [Mycobacterium tuberculosis]CNX39801.1 Uncharacterised protein [Mycobacterium tuberculosis]CNZ42731.1 Uncharacterised protein [Mycobacterium tuberculosis]